MPRKGQFRFIEDISGRLIVLEQVATQERCPKALVQCPICDDAFLKVRSDIVRNGHTLCSTCAHRTFIENIPDQLIILEQYATSDQEDLVRCPGCGKEFFKIHHQIARDQHTICQGCRHLKFIEDIPGKLIVLQQIYDGRGTGAPRALVQCPDCGKTILRTRSSIVQRGHSLCRSCCRSGERSRWWRGGKSSVYGSRWNYIRDRIRERDGHACQFPGCSVTSQDTDRELPVHHIVPYRECYSHNERNLITLCVAHHFWADQHLDESVALLDEVIDFIYEYE